METLISFWNGLEAVGSSLSVLFIVAIAASFAVLALVYLVASGLVLVRFAHAARRSWIMWVSGAAVSTGLALLWLAMVEPELGLAGMSARLSAMARCLVWIGPACAFAMLATRRALAASSAFALPSLLVVASVLGATGMLLGALPGESTPSSHLLAGGVTGLLLCLLPLAAAGIVEMRHSAEWFIAIRYLVAERRQVFISIITLICIGAVAAGVWLIITVLSVMNGFERTWREEIVDNYAHFLVRSYYGHVVDYDALVGEIEALDGVIAVAPFPYRRGC